MAASDLGTMIRKRRQVLGMRQHELAAIIGVDRSAVSAWERGTHFPLRYQGKLEEVLGISLDSEESLPRIVADNQSDPRVMAIWAIGVIPPRSRAGIIAYLLDRDGPWPVSPSNGASRSQASS